MHFAVLGLQDDGIKKLHCLQRFRIGGVLHGIADDHMRRHCCCHQRERVLIVHAMMRQLQDVAGQVPRAEHQLFKLSAFCVAHEKVRLPLIQDLCDQRLFVVTLAVKRDGGGPDRHFQLAVFQRKILIQIGYLGVCLRQSRKQLGILLGIFFVSRKHDTVDRNRLYDRVRTADVILVKVRQDQKIKLSDAERPEPFDKAFAVSVLTGVDHDRCVGRTHQKRVGFADRKGVDIEFFCVLVFRRIIGASEQKQQGDKKDQCSFHKNSISENSRIDKSQIYAIMIIRTYVRIREIGMKVYVGVESYTDEGGHVSPHIVHWLDGRRFEIQKVLDERHAVCIGAGGRGIRYTCLINGRKRFLFFEGSRWFVDAAKN